MCHKDYSLLNASMDIKIIIKLIKGALSTIPPSPVTQPPRYPRHKQGKNNGAEQKIPGTDRLYSRVVVECFLEEMIESQVKCLGQIRC